MRTLTLLGSTGSIGVQALDIVASHPERFSVFALTANQNDPLLFQQCQQFKPRYAVLANPDAASRLSDMIQQTKLKTTVLVGEDALVDVASASEVDTVLSGIVGAAALLPTMSAIVAGKRVLLANKESLVMAGELMMSAVREHGAELLPIDSEHNAAFQCLPNHFMPGQDRPADVDSIVLTASGGPFRLTPMNALSAVTPEQAVAHPNWSMGAKISVDSATMMNKGLEVIEAHWLFGLPLKDIEVLIHPQSVLHAFVRYRDGSVISHAAPPDMHIPIAHVLAWPDRIDAGVAPLDLLQLSQLEFLYPDLQRYPCLKLAYDALKMGGSATTLLNAANEIAVEAFLSHQLSFDQIVTVIDRVLEKLPYQSIDSLETVLVADQIARRCAVEIIGNLSGIRSKEATL